MKCEEAEVLVSLSIDGELDALSRKRLNEHLDACPECRRQHEYEDRFRIMLAERVRRVRAPERLKSRIRTAIRETPASSSRWQRIAWFIDRRPRYWAAVAMAAMLLAVVSGAALWEKQNLSSPPVLVMEMVTHHENCKVEFVTSEPEQVSGWLKTRGLPVAFDMIEPDASSVLPGVSSLRKLDYDLLGAHLCQILHHEAGYVRYDHRGASVSLCFVENAVIDLDRLDRVEHDRTRFYTVNFEDNHMVLWQDGPRIYAMIGRVPQSDLLAFAHETRR